MCKQLSFIFIFVFLVTAVMWSCATTTTIQLKDKAGSGKYLTDENGTTLYYYKRDLEGQSTCIDSCKARWPVFYSKKITVPPGLAENNFTTISRVDMGVQTAYRGRPLYYYSGDTQPGDMKGEGINQDWFVIYPDKFKP
jgi:predicted lipoprotein with Yx(FWY)xxD motif